MDKPTLRDFTFVKDELNIQLPDSWEICTSRNDDVIWNVVLGYLYSFPSTDENELTQHIQCLTGEQEVNQNNISINTYNPFHDRDSCFSDKEMCNVVAKFKSRVQNFSQISDLKQYNEHIQYLKVSSILLSCSFVLIDLKKKICFNLGPKTPPDPGTNDRKHISILSESFLKDGKRQFQFSFCIPKDIGFEKMRLSLKEILESADMINTDEELIIKICELPDITENFLISVLRNNLEKILFSIYKSPHVLSKIAYAGFETHPGTKDSSGKSAFFYALKTEESHIVFLLYDHAVNPCVQNDASEFQDNLSEFKNDLKLLGEDIKAEGMGEKSLCLFQDLCRFNEYHIEICEGINRIRLEYFETKVDKFHEVSQRIDILLEILKIYETYFHYTNEETEPCRDERGNISRFREFYRRREYFDKLDFESAVIFFDHLFLLKETLKLENDAYLKVESNFFLFISFRKYIEQYEKQKRFYSASRWLTFKERLALQAQLHKFKETLKGTILSDGVIIKPDTEDPDKNVLTLTDLPEFFGHYLLSRLQHFLISATDISVEDLKSFLVIERCLQVMGECCKEHNFNSVQKIFTLSLSKENSELLYEIRNELSHIKPTKIPYKYEIEKDKDLFKKIQEELFKISKLLVPLKSACKYQQDLLLLMHSVKPICKFLEAHENQPKSELPFQEVEESQHSISTACYQNSWEDYFENMHSFLLRKLNDLIHKRDIMDKSTASRYKFIVKKMFSVIEEALEKLELTAHEKILELDSHFWCLESFLTYLSTYKEFSEYRGKLELMKKERKFLFTELRNRHRVLDHSPIISGDGSQQDVNSSDPFEEYGVFLENKQKGNDFDDNRFSHKSGSFKMNQVDEIIKKNSEDSNLRNICVDCKLLKAIDAQKLEEYTSLCESADDSETKNQNNMEASELSDNSLRIPHKCLVKFDEDIITEIKDTKRKISIDDVRKCLDEYKIDESVFCGVPDDSDIDIKIQIFEDYYCILKGKTFLKEKEKKFVLGSVPEKFRDVPKLKKEIETLLKQIHKLIRELYNKHNVRNLILNEEEYNLFCQELKIPNATKNALFKIFQRKSFLKKKENKLILGREPEEEIQSFFREKVELTEKLNDQLSILKLEKNEMKAISIEINEYGVTDDSQRIVRLARDYFRDLKKAMEEMKLNEEEYKLLCEKLELPDKAKNILFKLVPKPEGNNLEFLRNRIEMLKNILIYKHDAIKKLWDREPASWRIMHVLEKIVQLYLKDFETQASVETLLFHCMTISRNKRLNELWKKTTMLFKGINLRNVLAHGHPLLESLETLLNPYELPNELVRQMLQLISDEDVIDCMLQILSETRTYRDGFKKILEDKENNQFKHLVEKIHDCDRWQSYVMLIPADPKKKRKKKRTDDVPCLPKE